MTTSWICVDASLVIPLLLQPEKRRVIDQWRSWQATGQPLAAPTLFLYEVTNVLYRHVALQHIPPGAAEAALDVVADLPIELVWDARLHRQALALAQRLALPAATDAHYLALASRLDAALWTGDARLFERVRTTIPWVHLLA